MRKTRSKTKNQVLENNQYQKSEISQTGLISNELQIEHQIPKTSVRSPQKLSQSKEGDQAKQTATSKQQSIQSGQKTTKQRQVTNKIAQMQGGPNSGSPKNVKGSERILRRSTRNKSNFDPMASDAVDLSIKDENHIFDNKVNNATENVQRKDNELVKIIEKSDIGLPASVGPLKTKFNQSKQSSKLTLLQENNADNQNLALIEATKAFSQPIKHVDQLDQAIFKQNTDKVTKKSTKIGMIEPSQSVISDVQAQVENQSHHQDAQNDASRSDLDKNCMNSSQKDKTKAKQLSQKTSQKMSNTLNKKSISPDHKFPKICDDNSFKSEDVQMKVDEQKKDHHQDTSKNYEIQFQRLKNYQNDLQQLNQRQSNIMSDKNQSIKSPEKKFSNRQASYQQDINQNDLSQMQVIVSQDQLDNKKQNNNFVNYQSPNKMNQPSNENSPENICTATDVLKPKKKQANQSNELELQKDFTTTQKLPMMDTQAKSGMVFDDEQCTTSNLKNKSHNDKQFKKFQSKQSNDSDIKGNNSKVGIKRALSFDEDEDEYDYKGNNLIVYKQKKHDENNLISISSHKQSDNNSKHSYCAQSYHNSSPEKVSGQPFKLRKILTQGPNGQEQQTIQKVSSNSQKNYLQSPDVYKATLVINTYSPNLSPLKRDFMINQAFFYEESKEDFKDNYVGDNFKLRAQKIQNDNQKLDDWEDNAVQNNLQANAKYDCLNKSSSNSQSHDIYQQQNCFLTGNVEINTAEQYSDVEIDDVGAQNQQTDNQYHKQQSPQKLRVSKNEELDNQQQNQYNSDDENCYDQVEGSEYQDYYEDNTQTVDQKYQNGNQIGNETNGGGKYDPSAEYYRLQGTFFCTEKINLPRGRVVREDSQRSSPSHGFRPQDDFGTVSAIKSYCNSPNKLSIHLKTCSPTKWPIGSPDMKCKGGQEVLRQLKVPKQRGFSLQALKPGCLSPTKVATTYMQQIQGTSEPPAYDSGSDYYKEFWRLFLQNENLVADIDQIAQQNLKMLRKIFNIKDFYENTLVPQILTQPHKFLHRLRQQQHQQKLLQEARERQLRAQLLQEQQRAQVESNGQKNSQSATADEKVTSNGANTSNGIITNQQNKNKRKKHLRRTAQEIDRTYICPYDGCGKFFGSEGSQNLHIKIKHNGGSKTDREKLAKNLVLAFANQAMSNELIDSVDLNLPPGVITKMAQKAGVIDKVNEVELLDAINRRLAPKFREMICQQSYENRKDLGTDGILQGLPQGSKIVTESKQNDDEEDEEMEESVIIQQGVANKE